MSRRKPPTFGSEFLDRADKRSVGSARWILFGLAGILAWSTYVAHLTVPNSVVFWSSAAVAGCFAVLALLVRKWPLPSIATGGGLFALLLVNSVLADPGSLFSGIIVKAVISIGLIAAYLEQRAIQRGRAFEAARN